MAKVYVAYCVRSGKVKAATTKEGLAGELGCSVYNVRKGLGINLIINRDDEWCLRAVELVKVGGKRGRVIGGKVKSGNVGYSGFLGMKGKDGLKKGIE